jgi:biopolymer transport protein ExbB
MLVSLFRLATTRRAFLMWMLITFLSVLASPAVSLAQEGGEPAPTAPATEEKKKGSDNIIVHIITSVGVFWLVLLPTSLWLVALIVLLLLDCRGGAAIPAGFVDEFTEIVNKRKFKEAFEMAKEDPSMLGRVLTAGMGRLQYGIEDAREAAMNQLEAIKSDKDQRNNYTAVIATLGPLLGLVGTVYGMIQSFMVLGQGGAPNTAALADGISHALAVTLVGVAISVPAIAVNTFFRNRITQVTLDVGNVADDLLTQMYHNSKKAAATPTAGGAAPTAAPPR